MNRTAWLTLLLSVLATLLNAVKPPIIDDPAYLGYARHFAEHPERPYDFDYYGRQANGYLVPPVLPAWLAIGIRVVGDEPSFLKLWLFPINLLFVASVSTLLCRFAPELRTQLLILTVFSPAILPSINLMLDIPVLAFGLSAIAIHLRALDKKSLLMAVMAGLFAGLAMETKYTAFTLPALFFALGYLHKSWQWALVSSATAVGLFAGCEYWIALAHGESHFVLAMIGRGAQQKNFLVVHLMTGAIGFSGGLASILWLVGLAALDFPRRIIFGLLAFIAIGYAILIAVPAPYDVFVSHPSNGRPAFILGHVLFVPTGVAFLVTIGIVARRLARPQTRSDDAERRRDGFLVMWLTIEAAGYLCISPFPAVRRLLGLFVAAIVIFGRLATRQGICRERVQVINVLTVAGTILGLGYYAVDLYDALAEREAFRQAVAYVLQQDPQASIRIHGTWGVVSHAEREGLAWTNNVGEDLHSGDWFIHDPRDGKPIHPAVLPYLSKVKRIVVEDGFPLSTQGTFYSSRTPIIRLKGPRMQFVVYRYWPDDD
jgi:hypothetical protein